MKKAKYLPLAAALSCVLSFGALAACAGGESVTYNVIHSGGSYEPYVRPMTGAEIDEEITLDGVFDEAFYDDLEWYVGHKQMGTRTATMRMTTYIARGGLLIGIDVDEGWLVSYDPARFTSNNSCAELYLSLAGAQEVSGNLYELDVTAHGESRYRVWKTEYGKDVTFDAYAYSYENSPAYEITLKGGSIESGECTGYAIEFYLPWTFFGRTYRPEYVYINPTLITPIFETGIDRDWYCFGIQQSPTICHWAALDGYRFDTTGFVHNDITITATGGTVTERFGRDWCATGDTVNFDIQAETGKTLTSLLVNGTERVGDVSNGAISVVCEGDIDIVATFA